MLARELPPPPSVVLDLGGGAGAYSFWLAERGHAVHLVDLSLRQVDLARRRPDAAALASIAVGVARRAARRVPVGRGVRVDPGR